MIFEVGWDMFLGTLLCALRHKPHFYLLEQAGQVHFYSKLALVSCFAELTAMKLWLARLKKLTKYPA